MPYATYRFNKIIAAETIRFIVTVAIVVYKGLKLVVYRNKIIAAETIRFIVTVAIVVYKGLKLVVYRMLTFHISGKIKKREHAVLGTFPSIV